MKWLYSDILKFFVAEFSKLFTKYFGFPIPNHIWMGTSVENNDTTFRISELQKVECSTRFVSFKPLLEKINPVDLTGIDWAIIGGESGYHFRPVQKEWITDLIKQCKKQKVKVFFKQWGGIRPKSGGREIDGKTFDEYPKIKLMKPVRLQKMNKIKQVEKLPHLQNMFTSNGKAIERKINTITVKHQKVSKH